jgi:hypothetical protein
LPEGAVGFAVVLATFDLFFFLDEFFAVAVFFFAAAFAAATVEPVAGVAPVVPAVGVEPAAVFAMPAFAVPAFAVPAFAVLVFATPLFAALVVAVVDFFFLWWDVLWVVVETVEFPGVAGVGKAEESSAVCAAPIPIPPASINQMIPRRYK